MRSIANVAACLGALAATVTALNPIEVHEQEFIDSKTGDRFMMLGVDYQPGGQEAVGTGAGDPLSNPDACLRDAALMQQLGINTIRTYNIDPTLNHDECVSIFNTVGIYMILDVNTPLSGQYIDRSDPASTYNTKYLQHVFSVIEAFKGYENTLGFFAGNEIINSVGTAQKTPQYIRAVQRDMKNYIKNNADRTIPVGYSAADVRDVLEDTWAYLQCQIGGSDDMSRSDFFGLNSYSWCGASSSFETSGYNDLAALFAPTTIPVFFSEYGCNDPQPRLFDEVPTLYGPKMTVLSGGLVYEWTQEVSDYGLISPSSNGGAKILADYDRLQTQFGKLDVNYLTHANDTATSLSIPSCSSDLISGDGFSTNFKIPDTPSGADDLINNGISNPPSGSLVQVKETAVSAAVTQTNGATLTNLAIKTGASVANYPGAVPSGGSSSGSSSAAAPRLTAGVFVSGVAAVVFAALAFAL